MLMLMLEMAIEAMMLLLFVYCHTSPLPCRRFASADATPLFTCYAFVLIDIAGSFIFFFRYCLRFRRHCHAATPLRYADATPL